jgi:hypothetical protein
MIVNLKFSFIICSENFFNLLNFILYLKLSHFIQAVDKLLYCTFNQNNIIELKISEDC